MGPPIVCPVDIVELLRAKLQEIQDGGYASEEDIDLEGDDDGAGDESSDLTPVSEVEEDVSLCVRHRLAQPYPLDRSSAYADAVKCDFRHSRKDKHLWKLPMNRLSITARLQMRLLDHQPTMG